jgi:hypothetical protein
LSPVKIDRLCVGRGVKLIYYMQEFFIPGDIRHRPAIMSKTDVTLGIDNTVQWHPSQLEQVDFLPVESGNGMVRVGQANKRNFLILPVLPEHICRIGPHRQDLRPAAGELFVSIAQARQLRATVRSHEPAQEGKHNRLAAKIG